MKGSDFVAVNRITNKAGEVLAAVDASCERVPADALGWLLEGGDIKPKPKASTKPAKPDQGEE